MISPGRPQIKEIDIEAGLIVNVPATLCYNSFSKQSSLKRIKYSPKYRFEPRLFIKQIHVFLKSFSSWFHSIGIFSDSQGVD